MPDVPRIKKTGFHLVGWNDKKSKKGNEAGASLPEGYPVEKEQLCFYLKERTEFITSILKMSYPEKWKRDIIFCGYFTMK